MKYAKGQTGNPKGRPKGAANKTTRDLREMILGALSAAGGPAYLLAQAKENPTGFLTLVGKLLPRDVKVEQTGRVYMVAPPMAATMEEWAATAQPTPDTPKDTLQ